MRFGMTKKDILVIGSTIGGCAAALILAKAGVPVAIVSTERQPGLADSVPLADAEGVFALLKGIRWQQEARDTCAPQAVEQMIHKSEPAIKELFDSTFIMTEQSEQSILDHLRTKLNSYPQVEWLDGYTVVDLITLENHSRRPADIYKAPTCLGAYLYCRETEKIIPYLAKETVLATGGIGGLFPYTTDDTSETGEGLALACRAGARCIDTGLISIAPLTLYLRGESCVPLPTSLLNEGAHLFSSTKERLDFKENIAVRLYQEMLLSRSEHLWLDLSRCDAAAIQRQPVFRIYGGHFGLDPMRDLLPIAPAVGSGRGGVAVDKVGQTSVQRLRAVGKVSSTGIQKDPADRTLGVVESLVWGVACAEDIVKQLKKVLYTFADIKPPESQSATATQEPLSLKQEIALLKELMWHGVALPRDIQQRYRVLGLLHDKKLRLSGCCPDSCALRNSLHSATIIARSHPN